MQQFSLDIWLQDKSRKVVTRRGNPVRIICTDRKHGEDDLPIVFLEECLNGEFLLSCRKDGRSDTTYDTPHDLFFADEKEELTEFESKLADLLVYNHPMDIESAESIVKRKSKTLLDLARKELNLVDNTCGEYALNEAYKQGKQDAFKGLPKWKKNKLPNSESYMGFTGSYFCYRGYNINYDELFEKLPKEE